VLTAAARERSMLTGFTAGVNAVAHEIASSMPAATAHRVKVELISALLKSKRDSTII